MRKINLKNILKKTFKTKSKKTKTIKVKKKTSKKINKKLNIKKEAPHNWKEFENEENKFEKYFKENL